MGFQKEHGITEVAAWYSVVHDINHINFEVGKQRLATELHPYLFLTPY